MRNSLMTVGVIVTALSVAPACATKKFVRTSVGEVNDKVTSHGQDRSKRPRSACGVAEGRITRSRRQGRGAQAMPARRRPTPTAAGTRRTRPSKSARTAEARAAAHRRRNRAS